MIDNRQLRELIIEPPLTLIDLYSPEAEELLIDTCAQETQDGFYLKQTVGGTKAALGLFQMQPATHDSIWQKTLTVNTTLRFKVLKALNYTLPPKAETMIYNLWYATIMARIFWLHVSVLMPHIDDMDGRWTLYKKYWNTDGGKATKEEYLANNLKFNK